MNYADKNTDISMGYEKCWFCEPKLQSWNCEEKQRNVDIDVVK